MNQLYVKGRDYTLRSSSLYLDGRVKAMMNSVDTGGWGDKVGKNYQGPNMLHMFRLVASPLIIAIIMSPILHQFHPVFPHLAHVFCLFSPPLFRTLSCNCKKLFCLENACQETFNIIYDDTSCRFCI